MFFIFGSKRTTVSNWGLAVIQAHRDKLARLLEVLGHWVISNQCLQRVNFRKTTQVSIKMLRRRLYRELLVYAAGKNEANMHAKAMKTSIK